MGLLLAWLAALPDRLTYIQYLWYRRFYAACGRRIRWLAESDWPTAVCGVR